MSVVTRSLEVEVVLVGVVSDVLDGLAAGSLSTLEAVERLSTVEWQRQPVTRDGDDPEPVVEDSWREVELARAARRISAGQYLALRDARLSRRGPREHPDWMLDLDARLAAQEAEDRRTPDVPGQRHDIRTYPGFAGTTVTGREERP